MGLKFRKLVNNKRCEPYKFCFLCIILIKREICEIKYLRNISPICGDQKSLKNCFTFAFKMAKISLL